MARRFITDIDLLAFSLLNAKLNPVSSDPSGLVTGDKGRVWFNTTTNKLMVWNGTAAIDLLALGSHTGTITASVVSDFDTQVRTNPINLLANPTAALNAGGFKITNGADGVANTDFATFGQLLQFLNNKSFKEPVRMASTAQRALSGLAAIDGVTPVANDRVLLKDQTAGAENGIYVAAAGAWARATDFDTTSEAVPGSILSVQEGTANGDKMFMLATNGPIVLGTTSLLFSAYGTATGEVLTAGAGILKTGTTIDILAGTGITVLTDSVAVDTARIPRKWSGVVPTATSTVDTLPITVAGAVVTFNHATGNICPTIQLRYGSAGDAPGAVVDTTDVAGDANNVTLTLPAAPAANFYTFMVIA